jgi:hypothetical protein
MLIYKNLNHKTNFLSKSASVISVFATINLESSSSIYVNFIYYLFLCNTLLFDKLAFSYPLHPKIWSRSRANSFSSEISQTFLSFPILFTNIL